MSQSKMPLHRSVRAVVMGASAGALDALIRILPKLPKDFKQPVMIVVHIPPYQESMLPEIIGSRCALPVHEASDKQPVEPGHIYFAPPNYHLLVEKNGLLSLSVEEPVLFSRPSIDVLFESAADCYGDGLLGVVLTGANEDGAKGLRAIIDAGGQGWAQRPEEALSAAMPLAALKLCPEAIPLELDEIAAFLGKAGAA